MTQASAPNPNGSQPPSGGPKGSGIFAAFFGLVFVALAIIWILAVRGYAAWAKLTVDWLKIHPDWILIVWLWIIGGSLSYWGLHRVFRDRGAEDKGFGKVGQETIAIVLGILAATLALFAALFVKP
jgi:hypothetical protein